MFNGDDMRRLREGAGLTQAELAEELGMTVTSISRLECGRQTITRTVEIAVRALCGFVSRSNGGGE